MTELEIRYGNRIQSQRAALLENYCAAMRALEFIEDLKQTAQGDRLIKSLKQAIKNTKKELLEEIDIPELNEETEGRIGM